MTETATAPVVETPDRDVVTVLTGWTDYTPHPAYLGGVEHRLAVHLDHWLDEYRASHPGEYLLPAAVVAEVVRCLALEHHANRLEWWGEDDTRIAEKGHVDLEGFAAAAHALIVRDLLAGSDVPEFADTPAHIWERPLTEAYAMRVYNVTAERARELVASGEQYEPCEAEDDGAQAYTVVDLR